MEIKKYVAASLLSLSAMNAQAASTVFVPTDGNVNFVMSSLFTYDLYLFDDDYRNMALSTSDGMQVMPPDVIEFDNMVVRSLVDPARTVTLTDDNSFILCVTDGTDWYADDGGIIDLGANAFMLSFTSDPVSSTLVVDVAPIPLPASIWLFGTGLAGLIGVSRLNS